MAATRAMVSRRYAVATELLTASDPDGWSNLGYWGAGAEDYPAACLDLALMVGKAAAIRPGDVVLELGAGVGAAARLWREAFAATRVDLVEVRLAALSVAAARLGAEGGRHYGRDMADPRLLSEVEAGAYDAVLAVDSIYHAQSLKRVVELARHALRPGGRMAFSTLVIANEHRASTKVRLALAAAGIPRDSLLPEADIRKLFADFGATNVQCQWISEAVLGGFSRWVDRRKLALPWTRRASLAWWKIAATGHLARRLLAEGAVGYAVVGGFPVQGPSESKSQCHQ